MTKAHCNLKHPHRSVQMSASVGADVCVGRCGCLRRSVQNVLNHTISSN
ncbi:hypothetical protein [Leyella stercorea]|nr:hypothetical protein [Leyella stercorea]